MVKLYDYAEIVTQTVTEHAEGGGEDNEEYRLHLFAFDFDKGYRQYHRKQANADIVYAEGARVVDAGYAKQHSEDKRDKYRGKKPRDGGAHAYEHFAYGLALHKV